MSIRNRVLVAVFLLLNLGGFALSLQLLRHDLTQLPILGQAVKLKRGWLPAGESHPTPACMPWGTTSPGTRAA